MIKLVESLRTLKMSWLKQKWAYHIGHNIVTQHEIWLIIYYDASKNVLENKNKRLGLYSRYKLYK